eukprot:bmy_21742T0
MVSPPSNNVNMNFTITSLFSGSWRGVDEETPSEENICVEGVSQIRTPRAGSSPEKAQPCKMCVPVLRDILHLAEEQGTNRGQKAYTCGACGKQFYFTANLQQHRKQHIREKPFRCDVGRLAFLKSFTVYASGNLSVYSEIGKKLAANMGLQQQASNIRKERNNSHECEAVFHSGTINRSWGEGKKASSHTDMCERVVTSEGFCECSKCGKACTQSCNLMQHQRVHTGGKPYDGSKQHRRAGFLL